jgi:hypothetical protein
MKRPVVTLTAFLLIGLTYGGSWNALRSAEAPEGPNSLPGVYYLAGDPGRGYPVWVDEKNMVTPSGDLNTKLIAPSQLFLMRSYLSSLPQKGCIPVGESFEDFADLPPRRTVEEATANSRLAILGTVTTEAPGFSGAIPGQLLRVEPIEVLKGHARNVDAYYVFFPVGQVTLGKTKLCKSDSRYPEAPQVGDSLIIFALDLSPWNENEPFLETLDEGSFITIRRGGRVSLPDRFKSSEAKSQVVTELLGRIRQAGREPQLQPEAAPKNATAPPTNSCVSANVTSPTYDPAAVIQIVASGFPSSSDMPNAMSAWNSPSCNPGDTGFPTFQTAPAPGARIINIQYFSGLNPTDNRSCGQTIGNGVAIYTQSRLQSGQIVSCGSDNVITQNIEHELGHVLGLRDSSCSGYIMSPIQYTVGNGSGPPPAPISRSIKPDECREGDYLHITPAEAPPPTPPPAQCPPDCECPATCENGCDANGRCIPDGGGDCELDPLDCGPEDDGHSNPSVPIALSPPG